MTMRRFRSSDEEDEAQIDISPLIDCVFILLIFFIVTTRFIDESGFAVDKPTPSSDPSEADSDSASFRIDDGGQIYFDNSPIPLNQVRAKVASTLQRNKEAPVVIQVGIETRAGVALQVQDQARLAGATKITMSKQR